MLIGGYLGVDIFFVISGYLIANIIFPEIDQGDFSVVRFYERRARRILPALFVVILAIVPAAWLWMMPDQMVNLAQSVAASLAFSVNIFFWRDADYFSEAIDLKSPKKPEPNAIYRPFEEGRYLRPCRGGVRP